MHISALIEFAPKVYWKSLVDFGDSIIEGSVCLLEEAGTVS